MLLLVKTQRVKNKQLTQAKRSTVYWTGLSNMLRSLQK